MEELNEKSINEAEVLAVLEEEGDTWMTPIYEYLPEETLPAEKEKARVVRHKSGWYAIINGILYKKSCLGPWLRILLGNNACGCMKDDSGMSRLPVHRPMPRNRQQKLTPIMSPWPFYKWGIGIAGPFPEGPGKVKFLIVATDYFTKWIEAKHVATITESNSRTTHSKIGAKNYASASALPPSRIHKPMAWWKEQTEVMSIWKAFGGNTRDLGSFGEETDKTTDLHQHLSRLCSQQLETASQITRDAVTFHTKTASQDLKTASECTTQPII
ncbi:reverse transcriptase domain-containing protein [Tanacetum coccineum]